MRHETAGKSGGKTYDVVVVGGGMAGLTAGAFAVKAGLRALLCDKEPVLGGLVRSFERGGFTWDAGIRALEDSGIILPMLEQLGIDIEFVKSPVSLGIEDRVIPVESTAHLDDYRQLLEHFYPASRSDIHRILKVIQRVMRHMDVLYGIENPAFKNLRSDRQYVLKDLLPWLGKFLLTIGKIDRMSMPVDEYLRKLSDAPALTDIISQHFFRKTPAFFALSYFSLYLDYMYPTGGTGALPHAMESYCTAHGIEIRKETRIESVDPLQHTVTDASGTAYPYRKLVWACDAKTLYRCARIADLPRGKLQRRAHRRAALVGASKGGDSVFTLYLAVDIQPAWFAEKSNGHLFYTASRSGVGRGVHSAYDALLADLCSASGADARDRAKAWVRRYIGSTTFEISIPVLKDATLAPPGKTGLIVSVLLDHALFRAARSQGWYEDLKTLAEDEMLDTLDATIYPGLREAVGDRFSSTPLTIERTVGSSEGAITGWAFTNPVMPAVRKMQYVARSVVTPLPDVSQAGQWTYSPSGLPIAILTGKLAADRVSKELRREKRWTTGIDRTQGPHPGDPV